MEESRSARLLRQIKEVCEIAGIKTEEYAKVTKKRLDVLSLTRELGRERAALGERVYDLSRREPRGEVLEDVTVQAILGRIANLESALGDCEEEIAGIRDSAHERAADIRRKYEAPEKEAEGPVLVVEDEKTVDAGAPEAAEAEQAEIEGATAAERRAGEPRDAGEEVQEPDEKPQALDEGSEEPPDEKESSEKAP